LAESTPRNLIVRSASHHRARSDASARDMKRFDCLYRQSYAECAAGDKSLFSNLPQTGEEGVAMVVSSASRRVAYFAAILALVLPARPLVGKDHLAGKDRPGSRSAVQNAAAKRAAARPFSAERFIRAFRSRGEEAKLETLTQAERLHRDHRDLPEALWQVIHPARDAKKLPPSLLAAVRLYAGLADAKQVDRQLELLESADARVVIAAAEGLSGRESPDALAPIAALRLRPEYTRQYGFRFAVLSAIANYSEPEAVDWLIETVGESSGQLKYEAARALARLTGENFGSHVDQWQTWWSAHKADFPEKGRESSALAADGPVEVPWDEEIPSFFNVPIYARRVAFVIDQSRNVQSSAESTTRSGHAPRELEQAVHGLPDGTMFNLIAYDRTLRVWREQLVSADRSSKSDSLRFLYSLYPDSKTACYDTLERALALDPNLELIVFLSDGEPNAGRITDPARIVREISVRNATTRVRIDVLGIGAQGDAERFLKDLAAANFGRFRAIR
jgi:hypothetical protein